MPLPLVYDQHMHTPLCRHAEGEPEFYAAVAAQRGLAGVVFTCHNPMPESYGHTGRMAEHEMDAYLAMIRRAADDFAGRLDVRAGLECDYFPGYERHLERQLRGMPFHHVLGSVHPFLQIWRDRFHPAGDDLPAQRAYFSQLADAAETRLFDTLAHPDLIKNQTASNWDFPRIADHVAACLDRIAVAGTAMELNTSGLLKSVKEMNPNPAMLRMIAERGIPVVVGSDAHVPLRVADQFLRAYDLLEQAGFSKVSFFLDRRRRELDIAQARLSLEFPAHADR
jgi:histidinol-phosphatase (PHP family)